jgi:2-C-methyl-D-erythritol 2,4-cyclodiphosphate synthase
VIDAMLGAMAMPNIGVLFPDSCEKNRGRSSLSMLVEVAEIVAAKGYVLSNADAVIMLEQPKLSPFVGAMRHAIARSCGVGEGSIGIKATTAEGLGHIGESMAIEVVCVCLLKTLVLK